MTEKICDMCGKQIGFLQGEPYYAVHLENAENSGGYITDPIDLCSMCSSRFCGWLGAQKLLYSSRARMQAVDLYDLLPERTANLLRRNGIANAQELADYMNNNPAGPHRRGGLYGIRNLGEAQIEIICRGIVDNGLQDTLDRGIFEEYPEKYRIKTAGKGEGNA